MKKKIVWNMASSLLLEVVSLVCAFVLPRLIMVSFGSEYNGIVSSVSQFLSVITLLRGGVGGVTRASLYKPLQEHDDYKISGILKATEKFMRRLALIFVVFLVALAVLYPLLVSKEFGWFYTFTLVLILGISTVSQYYFGITYQMLIQADQRQYVYSLLQVAATILNTVLAAIMINAGMEFRLVKLASGLVFGAIPVFLYFYVHKKYNIIKGVPSDDAALSQRWDAFAHYVANFALQNTDVMLLTVFSDLFQVSIYTVYSMITNGVKKFVHICSNGIEAAVGNLLARNAQSTLQKGMRMYEWLVHVVSTVCFVCTAMLIVPFVMVYTAGVTDTNYHQPVLGYLLCVSQFLSAIRMPYQNMVDASGHYRQTRSGAIWEAIINIIASIPLVIVWGSAGAVTGTVLAIAFRTVQYARYTSKQILARSFGVFIKRLVVSAVVIGVQMGAYFLFGIDEYLLTSTNYFQWAVSAVYVFVAVALSTVLINLAVYPKVTVQVFRVASSMLLKKRKK